MKMASVFKRGGKNNRNGYWYISWVDHEGKRHTKCSKTTDKAAAERVGAKLEADATLRREGVIDTQLEAIADHGRRLIESHLNDYEAMHRAAGNDDKHVKSTITDIRKVCAHAKFKLAQDINADGTNHFAKHLKKIGKSARTVEAKLTSIKGFTKWLAVNNKLPRDPLASVKKPNPKTDRRYERRMMLHEEWDWLRSTLVETRGGLSAQDRLMLYATGIQTGLRSCELRSLTQGKLFLESNPPYVVCKSGATKNSDDARQYIRPELAEALRNYVASKPGGSLVFKMPDPSDVSAMIKGDLKHAREQWLKQAENDSAERQRRLKSDFLADRNHEGEVLDFHALRHTTGAWLAMTGAHPKAVQTVMRHSSITLTMDTYGHLFPGQEAETVARFPAMLSAIIAQRHAQQTGRDSEQQPTTPCDGVQDSTANEKSRNHGQVAALGDVVHLSAIQRDSGSARTRTENPLIKSQML
jgi:integrase